MLEQTKPDFSGDWRLNPQASTLSPQVAAAVQSGSLRIEHDDLNFTCRMTIVLDGKPIEKAFELQSDGRETAGTHEGTRIRTMSGCSNAREQAYFVFSIDEYWTQVAWRTSVDHYLLNSLGQ